MPSVRVIGPGRAGSALAGALGAAGWDVAGLLGRTDDLAGAAHGVDLLAITTSDQAIAVVAADVQPDEDAVVAHLAGSLGLDVLAPHPRRAAFHPLVSIQRGPEGARQLAAGAWFAVAGDPMAHQVVEALGGQAFTVPDEQRAAYHAAACIASNHLVALMGQVERVAETAGVPFEPFLDLARTTLESVARIGPAATLTGPAARDDHETLARHLDALDDSEQASYSVLVGLARRLAADTWGER